MDAVAEYRLLRLRLYIKMSNLLLHAPAKINLGLEIIRRREDGYHDIKTVFCQVSLYDEIEIREIGEIGDIEVICDDENVPTDKRNTVWKAARLLGLKTGLKIIIKKRIPVKAGLGGGSSDAAAVLKGLNSLWKLNFSTKRLVEIAAQIGADVPYPVVGKTQYATGIGEILEELPTLSDIKILICVPDGHIDTSWAFGQIDLSDMNSGRIEELIGAVKKRNLKEIGQNLFNDFEELACRKIPDIIAIKKIMLDNGALGAVLTGTGSGVFGIFEENFKREKAYKILKKDYKDTFLTETL